VIAMKTINCKSCGRPFDSVHGSIYCSDNCRSKKAPAVYRFVCPDGRGYVGSVSDRRNRANRGIGRSNARLAVAFKQYPPETWTYEILELLTPGCSEQELRAAEQRHIDRMRSCEPDAGFNTYATRMRPLTDVCAARV
jgi:hypothetical protein